MAPEEFLITNPRATEMEQFDRDVYSIWMMYFLYVGF